MATLLGKAYDFYERFKIALDGPAGVGKGTIGRMLAKEFSLFYVQSSLVYRGLAFLCLKEKIDLKNINNELDKILHLSTQSFEMQLIIESTDLTSEEIGQSASIIASIGGVRVNLNESLKKMCKDSMRLVMEGRDIGTVVMPDADLKIFLTADNMVRANRRYKQLRESGKECILSDVLSQIIERDLRDTSRADAPLVPAKDAMIIDTSELSPMQIIQKVREHMIFLI